MHNRRQYSNSSRLYHMPSPAQSYNIVMEPTVNMMFGMTNTDVWYANTIYNRYWRHYQYAMGWMRRHRTAYWKARAKADEYENKVLVHYIQQLQETQNCMPSTSEHFQQSHERSAESEIEMEITEEMLAFLDKSDQHRKELKAKREAEERQQMMDRQISGNDDCSAPSEQKGAKRTTEMKLLYGKHAARIHGMETAMQLTFNRKCDDFPPRHWPNIPLNL